MIKIIALFCGILLLPMLLRAQHSLQVDNGSNRIGIIDASALPIGTTTFKLPATGNGTILTTSDGWSLTGNAPTLGYNGASGSFLGTTNTQPLVLGTTNTSTAQHVIFYSGNTERMRINGNGLIGVGTNDPKTSLDISGTMSLGPDTTIILTGGANGTINIGQKSVIVFTDNGLLPASTNVSFSGITPTAPGKIIYLVYKVQPSARNMQMTDNNAATASEGMLLMKNATNYSTSGGDGSRILMYVNSLSRWVLMADTN